jgi:hypothetical protein
MGKFIKYAISFILCVASHAIGDAIRHPGFCDDCFEPYGFPFTSGHDGGFGGGGKVFWPGLLANIVVSIAMFFVIIWLWNKAASLIQSKRKS